MSAISVSLRLEKQHIKSRSPSWLAWIVAATGQPLRHAFAHAIKIVIAESHQPKSGRRNILPSHQSTVIGIESQTFAPDTIHRNKSSLFANKTKDRTTN
ncbi:MAG: hypothetical protein AAAB35_09975 [Phyllobacterium sp.]|uniref:hypothetical protein n=1 Tax=Phyllobacterium sp. TaxID=1871046 RepID=UPI0030F0125F